ncbi:MAG: tRNA (N6-isopentenyl adenosine(37)-C2)-methylthiotransferase MiaB [Angelakisella sp.]
MSENRYNLSPDYAELTDTQGYVKQVRTLLSKWEAATPLACVHCFGCQQSVADGEKLKGLLAAMGYAFTDLPENADLVLYNTCAVRETAEARVFGNIGALKHCKMLKPEMIIGISGCMTEQPQIAEKLRKSYPHVDIVVGTNAFSVLPRLIFEKLTLHHRYIKTEDSLQNDAIVEGLPICRDGKAKAWVPVMYGCDNYCSYCIVPYVRGRERSRSSDAILTEATQLVRDGCREITLLGQNVNSYGKGLPEQINFATLLRQLNEIPGEFRIRFMTSHPKDCTRELIDAIADCDKVSKHLHLPVQSGCDAILAAMNRKYTVGQYLALVDYARQRIPGLLLTSDIIVGFPGESYDQFRETVRLVERVGYSSLFTFIYSRRSGTAAERLPDPVLYEDKSRWLRELLLVQREIGQTVMDSYLGSCLRVLVDGQSKTPGLFTGRSDSNLIVEFPGDSSLTGQFVDIAITGAMNWALTGEQTNLL